MGHDLGWYAHDHLDVFFSHGGVIFFVKLTGGPEIDIADIDIGIRYLCPQYLRILCSIHTADIGTVFIVSLVPGTCTLNEGYRLRDPTIGGTDYLTFGRAGWSDHPLKLKSTNHIRVFEIEFCIGQVLLLVTCGYHYRSHFQFGFYSLLPEVDSISGANLLTDPAHSFL